MTESSEEPPKRKRGLAALSPERRRAIAAMGGRSVPAEKRAFSQDPQFAAKAGRKGGTLAKAENRFFSRFPEKAVLAGQTSAEMRRAKAEAEVAATAMEKPMTES
jgi:general stress protein YciG